LPYLKAAETGLVIRQAIAAKAASSYDGVVAVALILGCGAEQGEMWGRWMPDGAGI
jgi:hypothetical protein